MVWFKVDYSSAFYKSRLSEVSACSHHFPGPVRQSDLLLSSLCCNWTLANFPLSDDADDVATRKARECKGPPVFTKLGSGLRWFCRSVCFWSRMESSKLKILKIRSFSILDFSQQSQLIWITDTQSVSKSCEDTPRRGLVRSIGLLEKTKKFTLQRLTGIRIDQ